MLVVHTFVATALPGLLGGGGAEMVHFVQLWDLKGAIFTNVRGHGPAWPPGWWYRNGPFATLRSEGCYFYIRSWPRPCLAGNGPFRNFGI